MKDFRKFLVWEKAHRLVMQTYEATRGFPPEEKFGLTSQLRRAAVYIPTKIAEGCGRSGDSDFRRFLDIAIGSASEVQYLVHLSGDLEFVDEATCQRLTSDVEEVKRMLSSLIQKLRADR